jgi:hypothetical protein
MRHLFALSTSRKRYVGGLVLGCLWLGLGSAAAVYLRTADRAASPALQPPPVPEALMQQAQAVAWAFGPPQLEKSAMRPSASTWAVIYRSGVGRIILVIEDGTWAIRNIVLLDSAGMRPASFSARPLTTETQARQIGSHWLSALRVVPPDASVRLATAASRSGPGSAWPLRWQAKSRQGRQLQGTLTLDSKTSLPLQVTSQRSHPGCLPALPKQHKG